MNGGPKALFFNRGSAEPFQWSGMLCSKNPAGGAYSTPPDPLAGGERVCCPLSRTPILCS